MTDKMFWAKRRLSTLDAGGVANRLIATTDGLILSMQQAIAAMIAPGTKGQSLIAGASSAEWQRLGRKNYVINGSMRVGQREAQDASLSFVDNAYASPDRWRRLFSGTAPSAFWTPSRSFSDRSQWTNFALSNGGTTKFGWLYIVEQRDMWDLRGQAASLQAAMSIEGTEITDVRMALLSWTGTADAVSADPITTWGAGNAGITTYSGSWAQTASTGALSGLVNTTVKLENIAIPSGATNLGIFIWCDDTSHTAGAGNALYFTDVQLEKGPVCTDFECITYQRALFDCLRYCWVPSGEFVGSAGSTSQLSNGGVYVYPSPLRAVPTVSGGTFAVSAGVAGTVRTQQVGTRSLFLDNSAANWTLAATVSLSGLILSAEL
jgi:hypothetical protein